MNKELSPETLTRIEREAEELVKRFAKETNRNGGVLISSSIKEFAIFILTIRHNK